MTIRIIDDKPRVHKCGSKYWHVRGEGEMVLAGCDTLEEAEQAKRAFEQVLLPRFTRDEAIAIVRKTVGHEHNPAFTRGLRAALVALADAGVFGDGVPIPGDIDAKEHYAAAMAAKLDAAGIR